MPRQDKSQKCYLDLGINLKWPNSEYFQTLKSRFKPTKVCFSILWDNSVCTAK